MYDQAHVDLSAVMALQRITRGKVRPPPVCGVLLRDYGTVSVSAAALHMSHVAAERMESTSMQWHVASIGTCVDRTAAAMLYSMAVVHAPQRFGHLSIMR